MIDINLLESIFDVVRIVNPSAKDEVKKDTSGHLYTLPHAHCFDVWKDGQICNNCISLQAISTKETQVKFEEVAGRAYLVLATPYESNGETYAVEMIKDITENQILNTINASKEIEYANIIKELNLAVVTDEMTQIYNKRYIMEALPYQFKQAQYNQRNMGIIIADIDYFKKINDQYGHMAGDVVLTKVAGILKEEIRESADWVARSGGEEFMIILRSIDEKVLQHVSERIRTKVQNQIFHVNDESISVTISLGGVLIKPDQPLKLEVLLDYADRLLYKAKNNGRNRVELGNCDDLIK